MHPYSPSSHSGQLSRPATRLPIWLALLQAVLAYEWLISGIDKLLAPHFDASLTRALQQTSGKYGWYAGLLRQTVLPNHAIFASLTALAETTIGVTLLLGAALAFLFPSSRVSVLSRLAAGGALLGSILLSLNYFFQAGTAVPWINSSIVLTEGVDITILIALLSLVLLAANLEFGWSLIAIRGKSAPAILDVTPVRMSGLVPVVQETVDLPVAQREPAGTGWWGHRR